MLRERFGIREVRSAAAALTRLAIREADSSDTGPIVRGAFADGFKGAGDPIEFRCLRQVVVGQRRFAPDEGVGVVGGRRRCHRPAHAPAASRTHS